MGHRQAILAPVNDFDHYAYFYDPKSTHNYLKPSPVLNLA
jgi:hypothetical protein